MESVPAPPVRLILEYLDYEVLPGSYDPISEHWVSPEGDQAIFTFARKGDRSAFVVASVTDFLRSLPASKMKKVHALLMAADEALSRDPD